MLEKLEFGGAFLGNKQYYDFESLQLRGALLFFQLV